MILSIMIIVPVSADILDAECHGSTITGPATKAKTAKCVGIILEPKNFYSRHHSGDLLEGSPIEDWGNIIEDPSNISNERFNSAFDSHIYIYYSEFGRLKKEHNLFLHSLKYFRPVLDPEFGILEKFRWETYFEYKRPVCLLTMNEHGNGYMYITVNETAKDRLCFQNLYKQFMNSDLEVINEYIDGRY